MARSDDDRQRSFWRDRPVLVTGAMGFVGSHVAELLIASGATVIALARDRVPATSPAAAWMPEATVAYGDVRDDALVQRILDDYDVRTVFHLAAQSQVGVANRNALSTLESNVRGTWATLEACVRCASVEQVIVASSDKAYGSQPELPYTEDMPLLAVYPYDVSKACAEMVATSYHRTFGVPVSITRCGNMFGPGDTNWQRLVPGTIRSLLDGERPIIRSDGSLVRDYLYVVDGARAYLALAEAMASDPSVIGESFNFSAERDLTVLELTELIAKAVGREDLPPDVQGTATGEIPRQRLSAAKARRMLDWQPDHELEEAIDLTVAWYREWLERP